MQVILITETHTISISEAKAEGGVVVNSVPGRDLEASESQSFLTTSCGGAL